MKTITLVLSELCCVVSDMNGLEEGEFFDQVLFITNEGHVVILDVQSFILKGDLA